MSSGLFSNFYNPLNDAQRNYLNMASWDTSAGSAGLPAFDAMNAQVPAMSSTTGSPNPLASTAPGSNSGFGFNLDTGKLLIGGLGTLGNLWSAFNAQRLARDQFNYTKQITDTNLANQTKAYNTTLDDRIRSRGVAEGLSQASVQDYMDKNRL